jgi:hypothetical protein
MAILFIFYCYFFLLLFAQLQIIKIEEQEFIFIYKCNAKSYVICDYKGGILHFKNFED